jgi:hypothetical protein
MMSLIILGQQLNEILVLKNNWKLDVDNLEINSDLLVSSVLDFLSCPYTLMLLEEEEAYHLKSILLSEIGRRNIVLSTQQSSLRRTLSDSSSLSFFPSSIIHKMAYSGGSGGTRSASSSLGFIFISDW